MVDYSTFELTDVEMVITAHFPVATEGSSDVYYTIYDKSHNVVVSRRKTNVVDQSKGTFSVDVKSLLTIAGTYILVFDITGSQLAASEKIVIRDYEIEQRDFKEYNSDKSVKKVVIKKTRTNDFVDSHSTTELDFEYNNDQTVKKMEENKL